MIDVGDWRRLLCSDTNLFEIVTNSCGVVSNHFVVVIVINSEEVRITGEAGRTNPEEIRVAAKQFSRILDYYVQPTTYNDKDREVRTWESTIETGIRKNKKS